jgi:hypothetical protein
MVTVGPTAPGFGGSLQLAAARLPAIRADCTRRAVSERRAVPERRALSERRVVSQQRVVSEHRTAARVGAAPQYQYGQPGGYEQPATQYAPPGAQFGEAPATPDGAPKKGSKRSTAILVTLGILVVAIVAAVAITGFWKPGYFVTTKLDVNKAQQGVQNILTDQVNGYGVKDVKDVKCNKGQNPTVKKNDTFTCDATIDGQHKQVTVTFQDDSGTYEVGRPKGA